MDNSTVTGYAPGTRIEVRDEEWVVLGSEMTAHDGVKVRALGQSPLVQGTEATFLRGLEPIHEIDPTKTRLVHDPSTRYVESRLFLEAIVRRTPLPRTETGLAMADRFLMETNTYQQRPAVLALSGLRPRILIADVVGFGKTLEIGLTLAELIRRGRGERILVVTPQHVLEQFQREMWTRFSIPLLRMDSVGIARVRQNLPAGRNPFTVHKRIIVSVDTLKDPGMYRHHLENIHWDAVVIDESHNLIGSSGKTSKRRRLADVLAPRTDALILASATPHNGDAKSFANLIDLLDPTAIADETNYAAEDIKHLYIRRTKADPELRDQAEGKWAKREASEPVRVSASAAEEAVFEELTDVWFAPGQSITSNKLFPYTLLKAFLSSPAALAETVKTRLSTIKNEPGPETAALERLRELTNAITAPAKLAALIDVLTAAEVGPKSPKRVVVFSERVATVHWLADQIAKRLKLKPNAVAVMHGALSDVQQQEVVEKFALASSPIRVLVTGDVASEGVNLHQQCHHLVHYDIPWSLIRIEQRNGRIDRYGQAHPTRFSALLMTSEVPGAKDDRVVAEKLLAKEDEAHRALGTVEAVTALYDAGEEEARLTRALVRGESTDEWVADREEQAKFDPLAALLDGNGPPTYEDKPASAALPSLFGDTGEFVETALGHLVGKDQVDLNPEDGALFLDPPDDLKRRLRQLPPAYLKARGVLERLKVTTDVRLAGDRLRRAKEQDDTAWPDIAYLSDLHPLTEWLVDKALMKLGRGKAAVIHCGVAEPTFALQGVYTNKRGRTSIVQWMAVSGLPGEPRVDDLFAVLDRAGVGKDMINPGRDEPLNRLEELVPSAVKAGLAHLERHRDVWDASIRDAIAEHGRRLGAWEQDALSGLSPTSTSRSRDQIAATVKRQRDHIDDLATSGPPLLRVLAVLAPLEGR
ncbi:helicase-related protein [Stackebrandtia soli]|uniref:helicase-related protein n=1 Tax=Stackebrandtia soli TaxID=1892856 RepID=UPI0039E76073